MNAENTRAFMSALPAARRTLLGCQSTESTVDLMGFFNSLETHQSFSGSKEQMAIALDRFVYGGSDKKFAFLPSTTANCKFVLQRAPLDIRSSPVDPEEDQSRFPDDLAGLWVRGLLPDISVPVLGRCDDTVRVRSPVDSGDEFIVLDARCQFVILRDCVKYQYL